MENLNIIWYTFLKEQHFHAGYLIDVRVKLWQMYFETTGIFLCIKSKKPNSLPPEILVKLHLRLVNFLSF